MTPPPRRAVRDGLLILTALALISGFLTASGRQPPTVEQATVAQGLLPGHRIVGFYGNPRSARMGILGALPPDSLSIRLRKQAGEYEVADPSTPVVAALHLVTVVAQPDPGKDGRYRIRMPLDLVEEFASLAERDSLLLFLDIQPGRSSVEAEVRAYVDLLRKPWVHLALDPEFAMHGEGIPGKVIGSLDAADVNVAIELLAGLVDEYGLPPKILVVHRFTQGMLRNQDRIRLNPRVQIVIDMDGFGAPALKRASYRSFVASQPVQFTGFKLFYRQDRPLLSAGDVVALEPTPLFVLYQ